MTSTPAPILRQRLQLALLNRHQKQKSLLQKGFTLVELMIVIVIVGVLSAVALPQFLGVRDKAETGAVVGSMAGIAKECATGQIMGSATTTTTSVGNDLTLSANCDGAADVTLANSTAFATNSATGKNCGSDIAVDGDTICTMTITTNGVITGVWS